MNVTERISPGTTATRLVVRCLGRFRVETLAGDQLQIRTRKARAVLAALTLTGRAMSREAIADLLWSDRGPVQAKSSLRQAIFELQHFECGGVPVLVVGRDDLAIHREHFVTDIELARAASAEGDWPRLLTLLEGGESGLLTDLDGLDPEFDDWLRLQRAQEPARTLAMAVGAAERCKAEAGPRAALELLSEILRLDPVNEEATRLALRIDHELGDRGSLHRHYRDLSQRLRDDYEAEPSLETAELFGRLANGAAPPPDAAIQAAELAQAAPGWRHAIVPALALAIALALLAMLAARQSAPAPAPAGPILIAVLPFDQQPAGDRFLADGLWEDTRAALSRNSGLRVLGRTTTKAAADRKLAPGQYRKNLGIDFLLEGAVRRSGEQVLVSVSLTRTFDGVAIWSDSFRSRLGNPLALQEAIAAGIEGKLRGRLAQGGGRLAENIATSPEVYARYSEARALIRTRDVADARRAQSILRQALSKDPAFAPAWSSLSASIWFGAKGPVFDVRELEEALGAAQRSIVLAPNLAEGHAAVALLKGENSLEAEGPLRRAVALDPSNSEAWNWLGNALNGQARYSEALQAYRRAVELDPLFFPPVHNFTTTATELKDSKSIDWVIGKIRAAGASRRLVDTTRAEHAIRSGDYSGALTLLTALDPDGKPQGGNTTGWCDALSRLGYYDEAARIGGYDDWHASLQRGERLPLTMVNGRRLVPADFWGSLFFPYYASRAMLNLGDAAGLVRMYRQAYPTADDFISATGNGEALILLAPNLARALTTSGHSAEAHYILSAAARLAEAGFRNAPYAAETMAWMAFVRAAQGDRRRALAFLQQAVQRGWLPDGRRHALDIAHEPAFRGVRGDPRFEAARKHILAHIAKERAELGPLKI